MAFVVLYHTAQMASNKPNAATAYNFTGSAVSDLAFSFDSRAISTGDTIAYYADDAAGNWERGLGTWDDTAKTITRTTIRESSTGSAINWTSSANNPTVWSDGRQEEDFDYATEGTAVAFTSVNINGTAGNGHIHLKHQSVDPATTGSSTTLFANSSGNLSWINDGLTRVVLDSSAHSSDWTYILPNKQGTIALTSDIPSFSVIQVDFGATETNSTTYTVNDPNITNDNLIIPTLAYYDTADHTAEEALCEGITVCASNVIDNTSYDIIAFAPNCTWGRYYINVEVI